MPILTERGRIRVALVQMQSGFVIAQNCQTAMAYIEQAITEHQAQLIVFPENVLGMGIKHYAEKVDEFQDAVSRLSHFAAERNVYVLLGSVPLKQNDSNKSVSRSILINTQGEQAGAYDKVHLFDVDVHDEQGSYRESDSFIAGEQLTVIPMEGARLGLSICYDLRFPGLYQALVERGAELIAVPAAFTHKTGQAHWEVLLRARAIETQCFILAANQCGEHPGEEGGTPRKTWGHSMIVDPWGTILCQLNGQPGICSAELEIEKLRQVRLAMPVQQHKRF